MELDEFSEYISELLDTEIPPILLKGLNLGIIVSPELKVSEDEPQFIIMGHYVKKRLQVKKISQKKKDLKYLSAKIRKRRTSMSTYGQLELLLF